MNPVVSRTSNGKTILLSRCTISGSEKPRITKKQETKRLLRNLDLKTPLNKFSILGDVF